MCPDSGQNRPTDNTLPPLIIGEVLFDCFPGNKSVIGGAPFNVAWNLQGMGLAPRFLSAIGDDALGQTVLDLMKRWGMDEAGLSVLPGRPTGKVEVRNAESDPEYIFQEDCAWDHIHFKASPISPDQCSLLYHGSLAARKSITRETILKLRRETDLPAFVDINLREPFYQRETILELSQGAQWLKLNSNELSMLAEYQNVHHGTLIEMANRLGKTLGNAHLLVTDGKAGAYWIEIDGETHYEKAPEANPFVDSVGAGDAFASICIAGILEQVPAPAILRQAVAFAANVCSIQGATSQEITFYDQAIARR